MRAVDGVRRRRRARPRDLQRLPGARRGRARARARCCATAACASSAATSHIAAERLDTPFTHALAAAGRPLRMPIAHGEGCYFADDATLDALEADGGVLFRYVDAAGATGPPRTTGRPTRTARCGRSPASSNAARQRRRADAPPGAGRRRRSSARTTAPGSSARSSRAPPGRPAGDATPVAVGAR